jgi:hypothetical protein
MSSCGHADSMKRYDQYQSVEVSVDGVAFSYRFRIRHIPAHSNVIVISKDSRILPHLRVGETVKMKYYFPGEPFPAGDRETTIKGISREEQGRFKGHFLVDLEPL